MSSNRFKNFAPSLTSQLVEPTADEFEVEPLSGSGVIPLNITSKLTDRIAENIKQGGHNSRYRSQWVRDAVVLFNESFGQLVPAKLVGEVNLYSDGGDSVSTTLLRVTYRTETKYKSVAESSKSFLQALAQLESKLSNTRVKKTRTDIIVAACWFYLAKGGCPASIL